MKMTFLRATAFIFLGSFAYIPLGVCDQGQDAAAATGVASVAGIGAGAVVTKISIKSRRQVLEHYNPGIKRTRIEQRSPEAREDMARSEALRAKAANLRFSYDWAGSELTNQQAGNVLNRIRSLESAANQWHGPGYWSLVNQANKTIALNQIRNSLRAGYEPSLAEAKAMLLKYRMAGAGQIFGIGLATLSAAALGDVPYTITHSATGQAGQQVTSASMKRLEATSSGSHKPNAQTGVISAAGDHQ